VWRFDPRDVSCRQLRCYRRDEAIATPSAIIAITSHTFYAIPFKYIFVARRLIIPFILFSNSGEVRWDFKLFLEFTFIFYLLN